MPFQLSPGVAVVEKDFTSIVPAVATSTGGFAGTFQWGPVLEPVTINSENVLVQRFGKPTDDNATSFFTAANFLSYSNNLLVVRADTVAHRNAVATASGTVTGTTFSANGSGYSSTATAPTVTFGAPNVAGGVQATGTAILSGGAITAIAVADGGSGYSGTVSVSVSATGGGSGFQGTVTLDGDSIDTITVDQGGSGYKGTVTASFSGGGGSGGSAGAVTVAASTITGITITNPGSGYTSAPSVSVANPGGATAPTVTSTVTTGGIKINNTDDYLTTYVNGAGLVGTWAAKYPGELGNSLTISYADQDGYSTWDYKAEFDGAPGTSDYVSNADGSRDEMHVIIIDALGQWTGTAGTILEKFAYISKASDAKKSDGTNNYYRDVINSRSKYIWWMDHNTDGGNWGDAALGTTFDLLDGSYTDTLTGGVDDLTATDGQLMTAWEIFADDGQYDVALLPMGKASSTVVNSVIAIAESRLDCVVFVSPEDVDTGDIIVGGGTDATDAIIAYRDELPSSSYAVMDSGYKYQYDRYNDKYRWVPLNGDVAGLCARTDSQQDPWFSPGGLNRGQIKNVVKLAHNPTKTDRDNLYKAGVNPVVTFPGQGTVLFGDKTLLAKPSAFDRINVRRLFIILEKSIATAAKFQLFEFNDAFTRAQFRNLVEPFLRDVQGRRGITDFVVKCDATNNTGEVIDANQFVADIFIKPNRSINFITLNFVAARSSVAFSEIGGGQ
jgi:phage tail sheath protein FI